MAIVREDFLPPGSRYTDTFLYQDADVGVVLGLWQKPTDFLTPDTNWVVHVVRQSEVGFLDKLAVRYFGPGMEQMWWVIAQANAIIDVDVDMFPGQRLVVPPRSAVTSFLARSSRAVG